MKYFILLSIWLFFMGNKEIASTKEYNSLKSEVFYSDFVKDSFDIKIIIPKKYSKEKKYNTVYFLDANINSGKEMLKLAQNNDYSTLKEKTIFIGIGHKGDFHNLRPRDFIPPILKDGITQKSKDKYKGHADLFYSFLEKELVPYVEKKYTVTNTRTIIGHSFGGLFAYYCMFKKERLFKNYFALSPSLWMDYGNIFEREKIYYQSNKSLNAYLQMTVGTLEFANYVLPNTRKMNTLLKDRSYKSFQYEYIEKQWANHNSHLPLTLKGVMQKIQKL